MKRYQVNIEVREITQVLADCPTEAVRRARAKLTRNARVVAVDELDASGESVEDWEILGACEACMEPHLDLDGDMVDDGWVTTEEGLDFCPACCDPAEVAI